MPADGRGTGFGLVGTVGAVGPPEGGRGRLLCDEAGKADKVITVRTAREPNPRGMTINIAPKNSS